jgi:hypothetical protein
MINTEEGWTVEAIGEHSSGSFQHHLQHFDQHLVFQQLMRFEVNDLEFFEVQILPIQVLLSRIHCQPHIRCVTEVSKPSFKSCPILWAIEHKNFERFLGLVLSDVS